MEQTTARLRKTFRYPVEGDEDDDLPEGLDEEEQEDLIRTLHQQNIKLNNQYRIALLSLPLLSIIPYLTTLTAPHLTLLSLLSISSLLSTAYLLYTLPPGVTAIAFLDNLSRPASPPLASTFAPTARLRSSGAGLISDDEGPLKIYLPYLNLILCGVLLLLGGVVTRRLGQGMLWLGFSWLPMGVYGIVLLAKWIMGSVDPESELGELKYEFKGP